MEIYRRLSVMWTVDRNIELAECDMEKLRKYTGG